MFSNINVFKVSNILTGYKGHIFSSSRCFYPSLTPYVSRLLSFNQSSLHERTHMFKLDSTGVIEYTT